MREHVYDEQRSIRRTRVRSTSQMLLFGNGLRVVASHARACTDRDTLSMIDATDRLTERARINGREKRIAAPPPSPKTSGAML